MNTKKEKKRERGGAGVGGGGGERKKIKTDWGNKQINLRACDRN